MKAFNRETWINNECQFIGPTSARMFCTGCPYMTSDYAGNFKCDPKTRDEQGCNVPLFKKKFWKERRIGV